MSTVTIKMSQSVINKNAELKTADTLAQTGITDIMDASLAARGTIGAATIDATSGKFSSAMDKLTLGYEGGAKKTISGSYGVDTIVGTVTTGSGTATEIDTSIPKTYTEEIEGTMGFDYTYDSATGALNIVDTGGTITEYEVDNLATDANYGKTSTGFSGPATSAGFIYDENMDFSGRVNSVEYSGSKHLASVAYTGIFNLEGNISDIAEGTGNTTLLSSTMTGYKEVYKDKSLIEFAGIINGEDNFDLATLANAANWTGNDTFNIELPANLPEDWVINAGTGTDTLTLKGGGGRLIVDAGDGDDYVTLLDSAPVVDGGDGTDTLEIQFSGGLDLVTNFENLVLGGKKAINGTGDANDNVITGNDAKNTLDGGAGVDTLIGGKGDDTYIVDDENDVVIEAEDGGKKDHVRASVSYVLSDYVEYLTLTGSDDINATGNDLKNVITGNDGNNTLDGGLGADTMTGGLGDDVYIVDDAKDKVVEKKDGGHDRVETTLEKFSLAKLAEVEDLTFTGTGNAQLTGNAKDNSITGGIGNDTLNGGKGADAMAGGDGDDIYYVDNELDTVTELFGEGYDTVFSSVSYALSDYIEQLVLTGSKHINGTGNDQDNLLIGTKGNNVLDGLAGDDVLDGLAGNDTYTGGNGEDSFRFSAAPNAKSNVKTITDFESNMDKIEISSTAFKWKGDLGALLEDNFGSNTTGIAETADQRFVYNNTTGELFYDADGSGKGKAVLIALLTDAPDLAYTDIYLYDPNVAYV